ncbi:MAG: L-lactate dehydrogenase, partial [Pseudomonadota bacterium]|nr:L-lactate dehydrogenase [Pseudomonadota bacterium]
MASPKIAPITYADYRRLAEKQLPGFMFDYIDGGCNQEQTMRANERDFQNVHLKQQVMRNVSDVSTESSMLGQKVAMPIALAPVGMAGMMARRGEVQAAKVAEQIDLPFTVSTVGVCSVEEVRRQVQSNFWFQLYMLRDRSLVEAILERAREAGCNTLVFTVDLAVAGMRHRDYQNGMLAPGVKAQLAKLFQIMTRPQWAFNVGLKGKPHCLGNLEGVAPVSTDFNTIKPFIDSQFDPAVTWADIAWLRSIWAGKLIIKGVLEADDAKRAIDAGADAVVVSNHGGRQLDGVASSISKLPAVVAAVSDQAEVLVDGGIRNGIDVLKALALGARGVMIGRPWVMALAAGGELALQHYLETVQQEMEVG